MVREENVCYTVWLLALVLLSNTDDRTMYIISTTAYIFSMVIVRMVCVEYVEPLILVAVSMLFLYTHAIHLISGEFQP